MLFSAELPWCCFMCRKQIFSGWPETPWNILEKIIKNPRQRWRPGGPHPSHEGAHPGRAPYLMGPLDALRRQLQLYIFAFGEKKNQREEIIMFYDTEPPPSPKTSREGWSGVCLGLRRGNPSPSSSSTILHNQFHDAHRCAWVIPL